MSKLLILLFSATLVTSCAGLSGRTFIGEMERESDGLWVAGDDFPIAAGDEGMAYRAPEEIASRTPASRHESSKRDFDRSLGYELKRKVDSLDELSYSQFQRDRAELPSISEQIYYLDLSPAKRSEYMRLKRGSARTSSSAGHKFLPNYRADAQDQPLSLSSYYQSRYEEQVLMLGMSKQDVVTRWGEPHAIDYAGDPKLQNERWSFTEQDRVYQVYFETGRVQGWELE